MGTVVLDYLQQIKLIYLDRMALKKINAHFGSKVNLTQDIQLKFVRNESDLSLMNTINDNIQEEQSPIGYVGS